MRGSNGSIQVAVLRLWETLPVPEQCRVSPKRPHEDFLWKRSVESYPEKTQNPVSIQMRIFKHIHTNICGTILKEQCQLQLRELVISTAIAVGRIVC